MKKIVIIGAGISGLSAGIYAKIAGYDVEIYEKNNVAGGQCMGWDRKGHHIDNCIHWLTGTKKNTGLRQLWETIGALTPDSEFVETDKFYESCKDGKSIVLWKDLERTRQELIELSPEDETEINTFNKNVKYATCCEMPISKPIDMMNIFDLMKLGSSMSDMQKVMKNYGKIDMNDFAGRFRHPLLKALFTDYMPKEYKATSFIVSYATIAGGNGHIPKGGSLAMSKRIEEKYRSLGGKIYFNSPVKKVIISNGVAEGIELESNEKVQADFVICALDAFEMFEKMLGNGIMSKEVRRSFENEQDYPLSSSFHVAFSIDKEAFGHSDAVFFDCGPFRIFEKNIERICIRNYSYEPDFAPEGKTVLQISIPQYDDEFCEWKKLSKEEYRMKKNEIVKMIELRIISEFPELEGHIEFLDSWTPLTYERYCNSYHGAYMNFISKKNVKEFRMKGKIKGLANVFVASQWVQSPGGLPVAASSGKFAVQRLLKSEKRNYKI